MNQQHRRFFLVACAVLSGIGVVSGCARGPRLNRPATHPVSGRITWKGEPLVGATVAFLPEAGTHGAFGRTDSSGGYTLTTFVGDDGAVAGDYLVTVIKMEEVAGGAASSAADYVPPDAVLPPPKNVLPQRYASVGSSGLKATVAAGAENRFDFALEK